MKQLFSILLLTFILFSCEKEKEIIDSTPNFPDSVELVENDINGNIKNTSNQAIEQAIVDVHYQEYILGTTSTLVNGNFEMVNQPIHENNSYISFTKDGYTPNYYSSTIENQGSLTLSPILKPWIIDQDHEFIAQAIVLSEIAFVSMNGIPINIYTPIQPKVQIQFLDFSEESTDLLLAKRTIADDLNFSHAFYIDILDEGIPMTLISTLGVKLTLNNHTNLNLEDDFWWFDPIVGYWVNAGQLDFDGNQYNAAIINSGYYAFSSSCTNDQIPPTPYCFNGLTINFPDLNDATLYATDIDFNSFDNCDMDLDFEIRRADDPCGNGSDVFASSLDFCPSDDGLTIEVVLLVTDDAMNADSCISTVAITGDTINSNCMNDVTPPTPYCISIATIVYSPGVDNEIWAVDFNIGSFDNCTLEDDLVFKIRKVSDICQNGSDQLDENILICEDEIGTTLELEMHIFDEQNNSDYCTVSLNVVQ